jgi:hypothetical protein
MRSTLEQGRSFWTRGTLIGAVLLVVAGGSLSSPARQPQPVRQVDEVLAAPAARDVSDPERKQLGPCPPGEVLITRADVGIGDAARCLLVGGSEVQGSRVDPLFSLVADGLLERIAGRAPGFTGNVNVICWSKEDWNELTDAFRNAGRMEPLKYWLGWIRGKRGVINLSYPACVQLDRIAYQDVQLPLVTTGAAVGTLAHETMHIAGILDEGIADCYAMQLTAATALGLGAELGYADQLRTMNFEFNEEHRSGTEYDSPDCYEGGPLDLDPQSSRWP